MGALLLMILTFFGYLAAYKLYGRYLARRIFNLSDANPAPSVALEDGEDYVPTRKEVIFGHHYASIAGTGPIVGPAIGVIWGWIPALVWVFAGSIVMGAVHDFGSVVISMRNDGKSISECAGKLISPRIKQIFFAIIFLELLIVIAIFGLVIAIIFQKYPASVIPVWTQIPIAVGLGYVVYKKSANLTLSTAAAVALMYATVVVGHWTPFTISAEFAETVGIPSTGIWSIILLTYAFVASILPVTILLQPRDYINAWQLFASMGLIVLGAVSACLFHNMEIVAPAYNAAPEGAPSMVPFIFITIACGAISGFHSLVASGTTSKQVAKESDALSVGYGSMLLESVLAVLVLVAVSAGIGMEYTDKSGHVFQGVAAWNEHYSSWTAAKGLGAKLGAFVEGAANMMRTLHIPKDIAIVIIGVFVASFAGTTLDTATRLQRYIVAEFADGWNFKFLTGKYQATLFAVATAGALAFASGADGKGALKLWPMFGAVNQLLAALGLLVITVYLRRKGGLKYLVTAIPCVFMTAMTIWAITLNERAFIAKSNWILAGVNGVTGALALWMIIESLAAFFASGEGENGDDEEDKQRSVT
jgi:carbon starvation protein